MPGKGGPQTIREIKRESPDTGVVILTTFDSDQDVYPGLEAGAAAFLLKDSPVDQIFEAIRIVNRGEALLEPRMARRILGRFQLSPYSTTHPDSLSARELQVLQCIVDGRSTKGIATELSLKESTVNTYIGRILAKLGARDRTEAVVRAARAEIIDLQSSTSR
jgi:DNA-binding NarL/FixJ family response regulator